MGASRSVRAAVSILGAGLAVLATATAAHADRSLEAESLALASSGGATFADPGASGGRALLIWSTDAATRSVALGEAIHLSVRARGDQCAGAPQMVVEIDGRAVLTAAVTATTWQEYRAPLVLAAGTHAVRVAFTNDAMVAGVCDRNLRVDRLAFKVSRPNPLAGARLFVDPRSNARLQADAWRSTRPADAAQMDEIATASQADWFVGAGGDVRGAVHQRVSEIDAAGALPVLVTYAVPARDCGGLSAGGAGSADAYRAWIREFAAGIGARRAVVILEPDALAGLDCLSASGQQTRLALLADAVAVLAQRPGVATYVDAGHSRWKPADVMADRLRRAGVGRAQGFALNVSNFQATAEQAGYGRDLSARLGGKHFVIDTSRNGLGPAPGGEWCNPAGRALGPRPGAAKDAVLDAHLWIKRPGESDGTCGGGPPAGHWWPEYALGLAQRAG